MIGHQDIFVFLPTLLVSILTPLYLPSPISFSCFILAVHIHECLWKHSCMSSTFPITILNGPFFVRWNSPCFGRSFAKLKSNQTNYCIVAVPMRKCLGEHSCTSSTFLITILNGPFYARWNGSCCCHSLACLSKQAHPPEEKQTVSWGEVS